MIMIRICCLFFALGMAGVLSAQEIQFRKIETLKPDFSDVTLVGENTFLVVSDYKIPIHPGPRVSLITVTEDETVQTPIPVPDWKDDEGGPSDLEACCPIPGRPYEYLIAESGAFNGRFGRIFHVTLDESDELTPRLQVNGVMRIYDRPLDEKQRAYSGNQVEGMACIQMDGKLILVYGERGGESHSGNKTGTIIWGELDLDNYRFTRQNESPLVETSLLGGRDCGSLQLIPAKDNSFSVIAVATNDPGEDGPFDSIIYEAGTLGKNESGTLSFTLRSEPKILARLSGLKVEGLALPAAIAPRSQFMISTDDEAFGAVLRPVKTE